MPTRKVQWKSDSQFNFGSPTKNDIKVVGSGDDAYLGLIEKDDNSDDIPFTNLVNYSFDNTKIQVIDGKARLKASVTGDHNWPFTISDNYTFDSAKIEVTAGVARLKGVPLNPYAWWHLNESSGINVADSSGNGRNGITVNMEDVDWVAGKLNNCLSFDGVNEYVNLGAIANFDRLDAFSVEVWIKVTAKGTIISHMQGISPWRGWYIALDVLGRITFVMYNTYGSNQLVVRGDSGLIDNSWHHIIVVHDGTGMAAGVNIYVDSNLESMTIAQNTLTQTTLVSANTQISGYDGTTSLITGLLDEVVIYDWKLSQSDVTFRYNSGSGTESMFDTYLIDDPDIYPNIGWVFTSAIGAFTEIATKPSGSEIKYQVSSDNGVTWKWWNGSSWVAITGGQTDGWYYINESNLAGDVNANVRDLTNSGTFKFKAFLHSETGMARPELDNIYIAQGSSYPTVDNLYVDTKDTSQIVPVIIFAWLNAIFVTSIPTNTDLRILFSVDGRVTWLGWNGSAWVVITDDTIRTNATNLTNAAANFYDLPLGDGSLDMRVFIYTSDANITPDIDNLNVISDAGYATEGYYESYAYQPEDNTNGVYLESIAFDAETPPGTTLLVEVRHINHTLEVGYVPYNNGDDIKYCGNIIQFKATMTRTGASTPKLNWVEIDFHTLIGVLRAIDAEVDTSRKMLENKVTRNGDIITVHEDDNNTVWRRFNLANGGRIPI